MTGGFMEAEITANFLTALTEKTYLGCRTTISPVFLKLLVQGLSTQVLVWRNEQQSVLWVEN